MAEVSSLLPLINGIILEITVTSSQQLQEQDPHDTESLDYDVESEVINGAIELLERQDHESHKMASHSK